MSRRSEVLLWGAQRISAMVLAVCVLVHLATMIYAVRSGLSGAEILGRTQGNVAWFMRSTPCLSPRWPCMRRSACARYSAETFNWRGRSALNVSPACIVRPEPCDVGPACGDSAVFSGRPA